MEARTELSRRKIELENILSLVRKRNAESKTQYVFIAYHICVFTCVYCLSRQHMK